MKNMYFRGVEGRGSDIISVLENEGATNSQNLSGECHLGYYYIDPELSDIRFISQSSPYFTLVKSFMTECKLKDGEEGRKQEKSPYEYNGKKYPKEVVDSVFNFLNILFSE